MQSDSHLPQTKVEELRTYWPLLAGCVMGLAVGVHSLPFYTAGLFMGPLEQSFGWTRSQLSLAPTVLIATLALSSPVAGALTDRYGEFRVAMPALVSVALGFVALAATNGSFPLFCATFGVLAVVGAGSATPTFSRLINRTFKTARGTALGIGLIGTGLASSLAPLLIAPVIVGYGWRAAYLCLAGIVGVTTIAIALLIGSETDPNVASHASTEKASGVAVVDALRDRVFWTLVAAFLLVAVSSSGLIVHFVPLLIDQGIATGRAAMLATGIGLSLIVARVGAGMLFDTFFAPRVAALLIAASAVGLAVLALGGASYALIGAVAIGLSFGIEFDLVGYLCARYFGMAAYGRIYGLCYAAVLAGTASSPLIYGVLRDATGSYTLVLLLASAALTVCAGLFLSLPAFGTEMSEGLSDEPGVSKPRTSSSMSLGEQH